MSSKSLQSLMIIFIILVTGCAKDRTVEDWRADQAAKKAAEIKGISGTYRGSLVSKVDQSITSIEVELAPDMTVGSSADQLSSEQKASLRGEIRIFEGASSRSLHFSGGYYGRTDGTVQAIAPVTLKNGDKVELDFNGVISGGSLKGELIAKNYDNLGSDFDLRKDGELPSSGAQHVSKAAQSQLGAEVYMGSDPSDGSVVQMVFIKQPPSIEEGLLYRFYPKRVVDISVDMGAAGKGFFPNAVIDFGAGSISISGTTEKVPATLICSKTGKIEWTCSYWIQGVLSFQEIPFRLTSSTQEEVFRGILMDLSGAFVAGMETTIVHKNAQSVQFRVTLRDRKDKVWTFTDTIYSAADGLFWLSRKVTLTTEKETLVEISGKIADGKMTGLLELPGSGGRLGSTLGHFVLEQNAAFPEIPPQVSKPDNEYAPGLEKEFTGSAALPGSRTSTPVGLKYEVLARSTDEEFLDGVYGIRLVDAIVDLGGVKISFPGAKVDRAVGTLTGISDFGTRVASLDCRQTEVNNIKGWKCSLVSPGSSAIVVEFNPKAVTPPSGGQTR